MLSVAVVQQLEQYYQPSSHVSVLKGWGKDRALSMAGVHRCEGEKKAGKREKVTETGNSGEGEIRCPPEVLVGPSHL